MQDRQAGGAQETVERVRRIETRLVQIADHLGVDVRSAPSVRIVRLLPTVVVVRSLDVSVSRIVNVLKAEGIEAGTVDVMVQGDTRTALKLILENLQ